MNYFLLFLIPVVAFLYASVGHGGASGYLALMIIFGVSETLMKPSALWLNTFVSAIAFVQYYRQGHFNYKLLIPFILLSIPLAYFGAGFHIEIKAYKIILAACLMMASAKILFFSNSKKLIKIKPIHFPLAILIGGIIGFISGLIGIGGGIILSPILILLCWADIKSTAAVSSAFIFLNSLSGLAGLPNSQPIFTSSLAIWMALAIGGGALGSWFGSTRFKPLILKYILSLVLLLASFKLIINSNAQPQKIKTSSNPISES